MTLFGRFRHAGGSLLEVLVSLTLLSFATVGALGTQLVSARASQLAIQREHAVLATVSISQSRRAAVPLESRLFGARALVATMLPDANVSTATDGDGVGQVLVSWRTTGSAGPGGCGWRTADARRACVAFPFVD